MSFVYVASPYSHPSPRIREKRYEKVMAYTAQLLLSGTTAYSPIVHCHELAARFKLPAGADWWHKHNLNMLKHAAALHVLMLEEWKESRGVHYEVLAAKTFQVPIKYVEFIYPPEA